MKFYVYEWYRIEDNYIFYVGKGTGRRKGIISSRNYLFKDFIENNNCENRIIFESEDENEVVKYESFRIEELHNINQAHCNIYEHESGILSEEYRKSLSEKMKNNNPMKNEKQRQRMRENNPMKDQKQRERLSKNNPMKDPEIRKKRSLAQSKIIIIGDMKFLGWKAAAEYFGLTPNNIGEWLKNGHTPKKYGNLICKYDNQ